MGVVTQRGTEQNLKARDRLVIFSQIHLKCKEFRAGTIYRTYRYHDTDIAIFDNIFSSCDKLS